MIAYLKGEVIDIEGDNLVLECNQMGYNIKISEHTATYLMGMQDTVKIYTYMNVREDAMQLFGFLTKQELDFFKKLITVNSVGPKGALAILSTFSVTDLKFAILSSDAKMIAKTPGIGAKTAERIILDLRDKIDMGFEEGADRDLKLNPANGAGAGRSNETEALEALVSLGYTEIGRAHV